MDFNLFNAQPFAPDPSKALAMFPRLKRYSDALGNTPLLEVPGPKNGGRIFAKLESKNPSGSIKDRVAFGLFCDAINAHDFSQAPLKLLDSSGGNMAKALAHLGHLCGLTVQVVIPDSSSEELLRSLEESQAIVTKVDRNHFLLGIIARSQQIASEEPEWTLLSQHLNQVNTAVHQHHTGAEIRRQLDGMRAHAWVAAVGTGGTLAGVYAALAEQNPDVRVIGCTPREMPFGTLEPPNGHARFAGAGGLGYGFRQPFVSLIPFSVPFQSVSHEESLKAMYAFFEATGIPIGGSSAANWLVARSVAERLGKDANVVTVFADAGNDADRERGRQLIAIERRETGSASHAIA
ncbi:MULTISPECIES: pyridoxal-phosphate dependent enzyme [Burkholderia]|uniref:Cysteine synthase n=1 Tax=Burkholderia savannae TaxID=1637837 RepID=A0ABR5T6H4_9BURK|nr:MULTISPECIES: pyridoxal-phosphate dependent enzyme [Burkholderia]AOK50589.1 cysteine synthase [Burkholderia sp. MSMB617WGS]KVK75473.1 cysteine synthase [Burkholderia sp. MSMB1498]KWZ38810.1 cysteine synthase [Burkholderia savannae]